MKKIVTSFLAFFAMASMAVAQSPAEQKAWEAYMAPGEIHSMLAKSDGMWNTALKTWMEPGKPPMESKGTSENKMILGGRYQQSTYKGDFMGAPFEGQSTLAYDNKRKVFISTWIDNMGTGIMIMEGKWNKATKTIAFTGKQTDPMTGKMMPCRETFKIIDDNTQLMTMWCTKDGKETKAMEIKFTRQ